MTIRRFRDFFVWRGGRGWPLACPLRSEVPRLCVIDLRL